MYDFNEILSADPQIASPIPNDPKSPFVTSGIRLGTPAVTTRGLKEEDMDQVAEAIALVIKERTEGISKARVLVDRLTKAYPLDR